MKRVVKFLGLAATSLLVVMSASAQTAFVPNYGSDPAMCQRFLSLYQQDYRQNNFDEAIINWRRVWNACPLSSPNLVPQGATMYKYYIDRELDQNRKNALIDTLFMVWEKGIELRPEVATTYQTQLMQDMLRYADTPENESKILSLLRTNIDTQRERAAPLTYVNYMRIRFTQNTERRLSDEELLDDYNTVSEILTEAINATNNEEFAKARDLIDDSFINSNAASRENLLRVYGARFDENRDNPVFLRRMTRVLSQREYTDSELFENASERLYELNPSPDAAYNMAMLFLRRDNFERAIEYFEDAINNESNPFDKARYNHLLGSIMLTRFNRFSDAKRLAQEASRLRPDWGQPYILLANTYASGPRCGTDAFEQAYVFWVAVDKLQRARTVDPEIARTVDPMIRQFSQHFPKREEAFFRNVTEGETVTVGCWIGESTRVRFTN